ncbi:Rpn family recombination-promoting nuclease/putative transposase [Salmonella enterica]|nr:Rpn family recombination-promoting nuclease/putative transposase [Salmonella enterica]
MSIPVILQVAGTLIPPVISRRFICPRISGRSAIVIRCNWRQRDLMQLLDRSVTLLRAEYTTESQVITLLNYMLRSSHSDQPAIFYRELANRTLQGESMMTLVEWFEAHGVRKGIPKGVEKGEREAARRRANAAKRLVAQMTESTDDEIARLINWR